MEPGVPILDRPMSPRAVVSMLSKELDLPALASGTLVGSALSARPRCASIARASHDAFMF
jgi:hypothetical protein